MRIEGIYTHLETLRRRRHATKDCIANPETAAPDLHSAMADLKRIDAEIEKTLDHALANERDIRAIERQLDKMQPVHSAARTLAMRCLEEASMRLRRELGDKPAPQIEGPVPRGQVPVEEAEVQP